MLVGSDEKGVVHERHIVSVRVAKGDEIFNVVTAPFDCPNAIRISEREFVYKWCGGTDQGGRV